MKWNQVSTSQRKAVNDAMTEFGPGPDGAKKLLEWVQAGLRPKPANISDETLRAYRAFVQQKFAELATSRPEKDIAVMRDRLEIYRIWLGE